MENVLEALIATQVQHSAEIEKQNAAIEKQNAAIEKQQAVMDKHAAGIRDLIRLARRFVHTQGRTSAQIDELAREFARKHQDLVESQQETEHKLNALIDTVDRLSNTVDRFIKSLRSPNGAQ